MARYYTLILLLIAGALPSFVRAEDAPAKARAPVPAYAAQATKLAEIKQLFKDDYASHAPSARRALARKLFKEGDATTDDLVGEYVLLRESAKLAIEAGDAAQAITSTDMLCKRFLVDDLQMKADALTGLRSSVAPDGYSILAESASELAGKAAALNQYDEAIKLAELAVVTAGRTHDSDLQAAARARQLEVKVAKNEYEATRPAAGVLAKRPDDPQANTVVGRFTCLIQGDWERGLPLLAKSADPSVSAAARLELAPPADVTGEVALGDAWWKISESKDLSEACRSAAKRRAGKWYDTAVPHASGLKLTEIESKLKLIDAANPGRTTHVVDLMPLIDPAKDAVAGKWTVNGGTLKCDTAAPARLRIPYHPPDEYDFLIEFVQPTVNNTVVQVITCGTSQGTFALATSNKYAGFSVKPNVDPKKAGIETGGNMLSPRVSYRCVVKVRRDGVKAFINDQLVCAANLGDLAMVKTWEVDNDQALGLGTWACPTDFSKIEVTEIGGRGKRIEQ